MPEDNYRHKLQNVFDRTHEFLGSSIDNVVGIRDEVMVGLQGLNEELNDVQKEIKDVLTANDSVTDAYKQARHLLADAEVAMDYDAQARMYEEAERFMRLRISFEERERYLRRRRDDLQREKVRMERVMGHSTNMMGKLRLASEILKSKLDSMESLKSTGNMYATALALQFVERENKRLAREIHDGPIQQFAAALLSLEYLEGVVAKGDLGAVNVEMGRVKEQLQEAIDDFRGFLVHLQPLGLERGLGRAIRRLAENFSERHGIAFELDLQNEEDNLASVLRSNVFRIFQEAVSNALRHGGAKKIRVRYAITDRDLALAIEDDGCGFDVDGVRSATMERGSFGLSNMSERIHFVNGALNIDSKIGRGTRIILKVPIGRDENEKN
ncbi:MAG: sensor histidine kinase [Synergistaceae bacterium]|jgi:two-component system sensor histidine kinase DegS|nr:sensor histidine kinase [Synergistaceae bacterium]